MKKYDVAIIGAGVVGCAIARVLSRYELSCIVLEKEADISFGVSKANSGIIHGGFHHPGNTLKAQLEIRGNRMFDELQGELHFPFRRCGILVAAFTSEEMRIVEQLYRQGRENRVVGIELCSRERILELEPRLNSDITGGLHAPTGGIIEPYRFAFALMESALNNGVELLADFELIRSNPEADGTTRLEDRNGRKVLCEWIVNAAGLYADEVSRIAGGEDLRILPRKGEEYLLDREAACHTGKVIFPVPVKDSKGMLVIPTVEGTTMIGPTAENAKDKEDLSTSAHNFQIIFSYARRIVPDISEKDVITSFSGQRPAMEGNDFFIGQSQNNSRLIQVAGIQSPGLTASPAIAEYVKDLLRESGCRLQEKRTYFASREAMTRLNDLGPYEADAVIGTNADYGEIVCRCEKVSEAEIVEAIRRGHTTLDGIKFYTRAGMGRCQGGFCTYRIMKILQKELGTDVTEIGKRGKGSRILDSKTRRSL